jgi:hypothetical protein
MNNNTELVPSGQQKINIKQHQKTSEVHKIMKVPYRKGLHNIRTVHFWQIYDFRIRNNTAEIQKTQK